MRLFERRRLRRIIASIPPEVFAELQEDIDRHAVERWKAKNADQLIEEGDEVLPRAYVEAEREAGREVIVILTDSEAQMIVKLRSMQDASIVHPAPPASPLSFVIDEPGYTRIDQKEIHDSTYPPIDQSVLTELREKGTLSGQPFNFPTSGGPAGDEPAGEPEVGSDEGEVTQ